MTKSIAVLISMSATVVSANDSDLKFVNLQVRDYKNVWSYSVTRPQSGSALVVRLRVPRLTWVKPVSHATYTLRKERLDKGNLLRIAFPDTGSTFTFEVIGSQEATKNGEIEWTIEANPRNFKGIVYGPTSLHDASVLRLVVAAGGSWRRDDVIDFKLHNGVMLIENDSDLRPSMVFGALLRIGDPIKPVDFLLSFEFAGATSKTLDGIVFGLGVELNKYAEIYGGVSLRSGQEISYGFKHAASQLVTKIQELPQKDNNGNVIDDNISIKKNFKRFENLEDDRKFDGFSTFDPITKEPIFPGDPVINSTNWALVFGIAVPIDIFNLVRNLDK